MRTARVDLAKTELWMPVRVLSSAKELDVEELLKVPSFGQPTHVLVNVPLNISDSVLWVVDWRSDVRQTLMIPEIDLFSKSIVMILPLFSDKPFIAVL
jgi:hypothetical protein